MANFRDMEFSGDKKSIPLWVGDNPEHYKESKLWDDDVGREVPVSELVRQGKLSDESFEDSISKFIQFVPKTNNGNVR